MATIVTFGVCLIVLFLFSFVILGFWLALIVLLMFSFVTPLFLVL